MVDLGVVDLGVIDLETLSRHLRAGCGYVLNAYGLLLGLNGRIRLRNRHIRRIAIVEGYDPRIVEACPDRAHH